MYAIVGLTGQVGGAVARRLLAEGAQVRGIVRDPAKAAPWTAKGVELATAQSTDAAALARAFEGAAMWEEFFHRQGMKNPTPRIEMLDGFNSGWIDFGAPGSERFTGEIPLDTAVAALVRTEASDRPRPI